MTLPTQQPSGRVFNIMRFSTEDGPGLRTTVFLKGCPLSCAWCHNPESQAAQPEIMFRARRCIGCGDCLLACPSGALSKTPAGLIFDRAKCRACGACAQACPAEARELIGREMTVGQVMDQILRDRLYYENSGGGVTFGGGEPLAQPDFLAALLAACRAEEIPTAVDTSGAAAPETIERIAQLADLFLFDLKFMDPAAHRRFIGMDNRLILENLRLLSRLNRPVMVRVPLMGGLNDTEEEIAALAQTVSGLGNLIGIQLLPFHPTGLEKYNLLGRNGDSQGRAFARPAQADLDRAAALLSQSGLNVII